MTINAIKEIILDFQDRKLKTGIARQLVIEVIEKKATVCIGVRRCGKSTLMFQMMRKLIESGVSPQNILYLNLFDDRLHNLQADSLRLITEAYYSLFPDKKGRETVYCFFDEIQDVVGWEPFIDRLLRTELCEVYLTGSSARMLSREIGTQMRGRSLTWELFPFSFSEFLESHKIPVSKSYSTKNRLIVQKSFDKYWEIGGFPEVIKLNREMRVKIHQEYLQAILFRDLIERHDVSHPRALIDLAHRLLDNTASLITLNSLTGYLKSLSHKVPKSTVGDYLSWLEDAYFLFLIRKFDASLTRSNINPKKVYAIDHAFVKSVCSNILVNSGHLLENLVFIALRRNHHEIYYYKTANGKEVDFITTDRGKQKKLVQVCETLAHPETRKREVTALSEAMMEMRIDEATIVTRHESEIIESATQRISVVPAWRFLLDEEMQSDTTRKKVK